MEEISGLLPFVLGDNISNLKKYLNTCEDHICFYNTAGKRNESLIKLINEHLKEGETRLKALLILDVALRQISVTEFVDNATSWLSISLAATSDKDCDVAKAAFSVLGILLKSAVECVQINKHAASLIVPNFLKHLQRDIDSKVLLSFLDCLIICVDKYPDACGNDKKYIELFLMRIIDSELNVVNTAAKCFALTSQLKGKAGARVSHTTSWQRNQLSVVKTLDHYLDLLFSNVEEIQTFNRPDDQHLELLTTKQFNDVSVTERMHFIARVIRGLSKFLQAMLLSRFPVAKQVSAECILGLVCRGVGVTCISLGHLTTDSLVLASLLPGVHADLLDIVTALIACCGRNLIQYGPIICRLLNQELKWTLRCDALQKPYSRLRSTVYQCLLCWLSVSRTASSIERVLADVCKQILKDVHSTRPAITIQSANSLHKHPTNCSTDSEGALGSTDANRRLCFQALRCLQLVIYSCSFAMKPSTCRDIQETIVSLLFELQNAHKGLPAPYRCNYCRKELYATLAALCMEAHPTCPPPITYAQAIFKVGVMDPFAEISMTCLSGLSSLEKVLHPSALGIGECVAVGGKQLVCDAEEEESVDTSRQSINDMPLTAFPNLNNMIVVKVIQNEGDAATCDLTQQPSIHSIQKTTINMSDSSLVSHNYKNIGDVIKSNEGVCDEILLAKEQDNSQQQVATTEDDANTSSLFAKINGQTALCDDKPLAGECERFSPPLFNNEPLVHNSPDNTHSNSKRGCQPAEDGPAKRIKSDEEPIGHMNGGSTGNNDEAEEEMLASFVDVV